MTEHRFAQKPRAEWLALVALLVVAMLLSHPYSGIRHDGILYFGDALARLVAGGLQDDLYFYYGSQGRFTLLPTVYAALIEAFGIGVGTMVLLLIAYGLQIGATIAAVSRLTSPRLRVYCGLSVLLGWSMYGGWRVFAYGEAFLTARSFAEPVVLLALVALVRGRLALGAILLVVAAAIHPLMGLSGLVVGWLWLCQRDRRAWWLVVAAVVAYVSIGLWGGGSFSDVFSQYDEQWLELVIEANPQAFVSTWRISDGGSIAFACVVLWLVARSTNERLRVLARAALTGGLLCLAVSYVAVDLLHNPFFGKLQIWRALWLTQWFAMMSFPVLVSTLWHRSESGKLTALLLAIGWIAPFSIAPAVVAVAALVIDHFGHRIAISSTTTRIVAALVVLIALVVAGQSASRAIKVGILVDQPWAAIIGQVISTNLVVAALVMTAYFAWTRRVVVGVVAVALLLLVGIGMWDQRSPWTRRMESAAIGTNIWPGKLQSASRVYWYRDLIAPWILLGHANYYTQQQSSGAVFSREMTIELDRRRKLTALLDFQEQICRMMNALNEKANSCEPDSEAVKDVCSDGQIDFVVLQSTLEGHKPTADFSTGVVENGYEKKFFLYRCSALKSG